jgi:hypothetical protein
MANVKIKWRVLKDYDVRALGTETTSLRVLRGTAAKFEEGKRGSAWNAVFQATGKVSVSPVPVFAVA